MYSPDQRRQLLALARASLQRVGDTGRLLPELDTSLGEQRRAAFVTLTHHERLRGCIGNLESDKPLAATIADLAVSAATEDPRFARVREDEVDDVHIEISVLTPAKEAKAEDVEVGTHGIIVERAHRRGILLPQVATEHGMSREEFLDAACHKAGLPPGAWKEPGTRLQTFTAEVFGEHL